MIARLVFASCLLALASTWAAPASAFTVTRVTSEHGVEAWLVEDHSNPIISMSFDFRGGASVDPAPKAGLSALVANLLDEGAGNLDSKTFQSRLDQNGISMSFFATSDSLHGRLRTIRDKRDMAMDLLGQALAKPRFDPTAVDRVRAQTLADLDRTIDEPDSIAGRTLLETLFPGHPYGEPINGLPGTVSAISRNDLVAWAAHHIGRDVLTVAVVGDITPAELHAALDSAFGSVPEHADPRTLTDVAPNASGSLQVIRRPIPQSVAVFAEPGLKRNDPDWYAALLLTNILGGGFSSRLVTEIRDKRGLAYQVYSNLDPYDHAGLVVGGVSTRNDRIGESLGIVREQWRKLADNGVTADELAAAKSYINGSFPLQMGSSGAIAEVLNQIERDHLGIDFVTRRSALVDAVSLADVNRVAKQLLKADNLSVVVVGDPVGM